MSYSRYSNTQADMMMHFKQSESIFLYCQYVDEYGQLIDLPEYITATVCTFGGYKVVDMTVIKDAYNLGRFTLTTQEKVAIGSYECDVLFTNMQGVRIASNTFEIKVTHSISQSNQTSVNINSPHPHNTAAPFAAANSGRLMMVTPTGKRTMLDIGRYAPSRVNPKELISGDTPNALKIGSDGKLVVDNVDDVSTDADFVSVIDATWNI